MRTTFPPPSSPQATHPGLSSDLSAFASSRPGPLFTSEARTPTPAVYTEGMLGLQLYPWQRDVLEWYSLPRTRVLGALSTPNGAGKTSCIVAGLAFWWLTAHPTGHVVITTKDGKQLEQQLLPAFHRFRVRVPGWSWSHSGYTEITNPYGGRIVAFTTNDAGRAEGWHKGADNQSPLLVIVDEAKSVAEEIFQAIDRCTFNSLLYVSSPGLMLGTFFNAFTGNAALFRRCQVGARDCPHIPADRIAGVIAKYGADHPLTRSTIDGEFMDQDATSSFVFQLSMLQRVLVRDQRPPPPHRDRSAFCDFAAGGDENVLAIRDGAYVRVAAAWRDPDTAAAATRFVREFHSAGLKPDEIFADEGGLGRPMVDHLAMLGWRINRVNFGARAYDPVYENRGSEMWHATSADVSRGQIKIVYDDLLIAQLSSRKAKVSSAGRLGLESKDDLKRRGGASPDRADAVGGAWTCRSPFPVPRY